MSRISPLPCFISLNQVAGEVLHVDGGANTGKMLAQSSLGALRRRKNDDVQSVLIDQADSDGEQLDIHQISDPIGMLGQVRSSAVSRNARWHSVEFQVGRKVTNSVSRKMIQKKGERT